MKTIDYLRIKSMDNVIEKYNILLTLLNALMEKMGKDKITDAIEFKSIRRDQLCTQENENLIEQHIDNIHIYFSKNLTRYAYRHSVKNFLLSLLKIITEAIGLQFVSNTITERRGKIVVATVLYNIIISE